VDVSVRASCGSQRDDGSVVAASGMAVARSDNAADLATAVEMRAFHKEVISRLALLQEALTAARKPRPRKK
jgi:hypothetical protein